ncbi:hypothetical protein SteCoe_3739 [Stentor coeruleus]|uniref:CBM20 domain-containing protein n=1 Tax=Stentor coeruleus TaxID=5963 RepID=A0A1R2CW97_9CILI|nr:hypothetical protein SteCoe_3739 [Stentor coeruleus]
MKQSISKVFIEYNAEDSQNYKIVGNTINTGNWDPDHGITLNQSETCYTVALSFPMNFTFEYKYIKLTNPAIWEALGNRKIHCKHPVIHVKDWENSGTSQVSYQSESSKQHHYDKLPAIKEHIKFSLSDSIIFANFNLPIRVSRNPLYKPEKLNSKNDTNQTDFEDSINDNTRVFTSQDNHQEKWIIEKNKGIWLPVLFDLTIDKSIDILWIGWPGIIIDDENEQRELSDMLVKQFRCYPVFLTESLLNDFNFFCNTILFPVFNNIIHMNRDDIPQYSLEQWEIYKSVNSIFSEAIMNSFTSQIIWINDFSLMLTPNFVSRRIHELLNIGFYLQSPFPSTDMFRVLPQAEAILHSILACDLVSFHSYDYASEFLKTCKLLIGVEHHFSKEGCLLIEYFGRHIMIRVGDIGVEADKIKEAMTMPEYFRFCHDIREKYQGRELVIGIDTMQELSGLTLKLKAFGKYSQKCAYKPILLQYLTKPKLTFGFEATRIHDNIYSIQKEVNDNAGIIVIDLIEENLSAVQRYSLMNECKAFVNTCFKDSMCLIPYEFLIVTEGNSKPVIVSESAGVSKSLRSFMKINPYSEQNIYHAFCNMFNKENFVCRNHDMKWVKKCSMQRWAVSFLGDLKKAQKNPKLMQYMKHGMGDKMKLVALRKNFSKLDLESLMITYKRANYRALFFDNEGTLVDSMKGDSRTMLTCMPKAKLLDCLSDLAKDPQNMIFIITGREKKVLESAYNIQHLGLAAEFGAFIRWSPDVDWETRGAYSEVWKESAKHIIASYVARTEGSYIEEKECSVVFQYKNCDTEYGAWQAKELASQLDVLLHPYIEECEVFEGTGYVEVKPRMINKGYTIEYIMQKCSEAGVVFDFILVVGDDSSDEEMFKALKELAVTKHTSLSISARCFSCTLGRKPTKADYYLNDSAEILQYLEALRHWTKRDYENFVNLDSAMHIVDIIKDRREKINGKD